MSGIPLQIVSIDTDGDGDSFTLNTNNLNSIIAKVVEKDPLTRISIVSVVGAFRTGKSFLLNLFLRYLRSGNPSDLSEGWMFTEGDEISEGNMNVAAAAAAATPAVSASGDESSPAPAIVPERKVQDSSFRWRGGKERETTGIWMWSEPFFRPASDGSGVVAVLLMDTQGMFDHETSMTLTAQIFGLSTFISSYQIYNVDKQIQEDNLQHLALFTEYGKMANDKQKRSPSSRSILSESASTEKSAVMSEPSVSSSAESEAVETQLTSAAEEKAVAEEEEVVASPPPKQPFQRLQFLVRDWQNFENELEDDASAEEKENLVTKLDEERREYMSMVFKEKTLKDLKGTRDAITRCFEKIDCFQLPHPGLAVINKKYSGSIQAISPFFRFLINRLVRNVFDNEMIPKVIHNRPVRGLELFTYFDAFVSLFTKGSRGFPQPQTIYDATADANNRNCVIEALHGYKTSMTSLVGEGKPYIQPEVFQSAHRGAYDAALILFDEHATMGAESAIEAARAGLVKEMETERARYSETNALRNPFRDLERVIVPLAVAAGAWIIALLFDFWCTSDHCEAVEDTFERVYMFIAFGILLFAYYNPFKDAVMYSVPIAAAVAAWFVSAIINSACTSSTCQKLTGAFARIYIFVFFAAAVLAWKSFGNLNSLVGSLSNVTGLAQQLQQMNAGASAGASTSPSATK